MLENELKNSIEVLLKEKIQTSALKGEGMCNKVFIIETETGKKYLVKVEKPNKETEEQNDLMVEGKLIEKLNKNWPSLLVPSVLLVTDLPKMYMYKYVEGEMMIDAWSSLNEEQKINLCRDIGYFHSELHNTISSDEAKGVGLQVSTESYLEKAIVDQYNEFLNDENMPESWKKLVVQAREIFDQSGSGIFKFIHNDAHNENIIINNSRLVGFVDFGDSEFGDIHKDFCYYVGQYPKHFKYIIEAYQEVSSTEISVSRIVSYAFLRDLGHISYYFSNPEREKERLQKLPGISVSTRVENYKRLLNL